MPGDPRPEGHREETNVRHIDDTVGSLSVLNVGRGDLKFRFDTGDPEEVAQARRVIEDMLRRGYTILVEVGGELRRATGFDPAKGCYLVTEPPPEPEAATTPDAVPPDAATAPTPRRPRKGRRREIPIGAAKAIAFAPTAGG